MDDRFLCGIVCGMLGGALIATHSVKTRQVVKEGEEQVKEKVKQLTKQSQTKNK